MFTKEELARFKTCRRKSPWVKDYSVTSEAIHITDNMYNLDWILFRYTLDDRNYYVIKRVPMYVDDLVESSTAESIEDVMKAFENILWKKVQPLEPDLSKIPLEYIVSAPKRLGIPALTTVFLKRMLPYKTASIR